MNLCLQEQTNTQYLSNVQPGRTRQFQPDKQITTTTTTKQTINHQERLLQFLPWKTAQKSTLVPSV